jgi:hypothetical protein
VLVQRGQHLSQAPPDGACTGWPPGADNLTAQAAARRCAVDDVTKCRVTADMHSCCDLDIITAAVVAVAAAAAVAVAAGHGRPCPALQFTRQQLTDGNLYTMSGKEETHTHTGLALCNLYPAWCDNIDRAAVQPKPSCCTPPVWTHSKKNSLLLCLSKSAPTTSPTHLLPVPSASPVLHPQ